MMTLAHILVLVEARSCLAALADTAVTFDASVSYERTLLMLDGVYGDVVPALEPLLGVPVGLLLERVEAVVEALRDFGLDGLRLELLIVMVEDAHALDVATLSTVLPIRRHPLLRRDVPTVVPNRDNRALLAVMLNRHHRRDLR